MAIAVIPLTGFAPFPDTPQLDNGSWSGDGTSLAGTASVSKTWINGDTPQVGFIALGGWLTQALVEAAILDATIAITSITLHFLHSFTSSPAGKICCYSGQTCLFGGDPNASEHEDIVNVVPGMYPEVSGPTSILWDQGDVYSIVQTQLYAEICQPAPDGTSISATHTNADAWMEIVYTPITASENVSNDQLVLEVILPFLTLEDAVPPPPGAPPVLPPPSGPFPLPPPFPPPPLPPLPPLPPPPPPDNGPPPLPPDPPIPPPLPPPPRCP